MKKADFNKNPDGLLPAIIQDSKTQKILMLGYMNAESLEITQNSGKVTFYSRSKKRIWTKGEESGNFLYLVDIAIDCDLDTFLIKVNPKGPTCHKGTDTCWDEENTLNAVKNFQHSNAIRGILTLANDVPYTVAYVANYLGLPSISLNTASVR